MERRSSEPLPAFVATGGHEAAGFVSIPVPGRSHEVTKGDDVFHTVAPKILENFDSE